MKKLSILFLVFLSLNSLAYSELKGCYETISFNAQDVVSGPSALNSQSEFFLTDNQYYRDLETFKELKTLVVSVFNGYNDPWYGFSNVIIPVEKGEWTKVGNEISFKMNEDIMYYSSNYERIKVDFLVDAKFKIVGDEIEGDFYFSSVRRGLFYDFSARLKKKECL
ncbi:putative lipoprotein [Halobacteriovorax marinus SJ]|uniref:Lipoprotein n=1 Tax=Halobacteriovorax marinus (strain ATCC BAA-682 / DSM 15412 / SJ) TaxID=862908 RepID=E1X009_HALMS|nr:hypothetical protein [Halobacteriovorax marinus]CBW27945.1 putative lipoprotein [Halobacteriovorax marinus SJ]